MMTDQERLEDAIQAAFTALKPKYGAVRNDYYGLVFVERALGLPRDRAVEQVGFGGADQGIDGFAFDREDGTFRLFQFKNSRSVAQVQSSMRRLSEAGLPSLFNRAAVPDHQPIVDAARRALAAAAPEIRRVFVDFVFRGDVEEATGGAAHAALREDIEKHSWRFADLAGREVPLELRVLQFDGLRPVQPTERHALRLDGGTVARTADGVGMHVGFVPLVDLMSVHGALGARFLERNVRFGLGAGGHVNRALTRSMRDILLRDEADPAAFALHHNGVTLSAQRLDLATDPPTIFAPRLLNGAQTVTTFSRVAEELGGKFRAIPEERLSRFRVLCRIVVGAQPERVTRITIDANRQNPVDAWLLHANDLIQLEFADFFRPLGIYYQRQASGFGALTQEEREEASISDTKPVEMIKLARTYLAAEGELGRLSQIGEVADSEKQYAEVFNRGRLAFDPRVLVLCYKAQFRLARLASAIRDMGTNRYAFAHRGKEIIWGLACQALLNDPDLPEHADHFGGSLSLPSAYVDLLHGYAVTPIRLILGALISESPFREAAQEDSYSFLRKAATFDRAMRIAGQRYGWTRKRLC